MKRTVPCLIVILATACVLAMVPSPAEADGCVRSRTVCFAAPTIVAPSYVAPVVTTQTHHVTPYAVPLHVQTVPYIFSALNEGVIADAAAFRAYQLLLQQQAQGGNAGGAQPPRRGMPPADGPATDPPLQQRGQVKTAVDAKLQTIVTASCLKCHSGAVTKGGLDLSDLSTVSEYSRLKCLVKVNRGEMPPGGALADADVQPFDSWAKAAEVVRK